MLLVQSCWKLGPRSAHLMCSTSPSSAASSSLPSPSCCPCCWWYLQQRGLTRHKVQSHCSQHCQGKAQERHAGPCFWCIPDMLCDSNQCLCSSKRRHC